MTAQAHGTTQFYVEGRVASGRVWPMGLLSLRSKKLGSIEVVLLAMLLCCIASQAIAASAADVEIRYLLGYLERSGCTFNRNGTWYAASDARAHLERKYRYLVDKGLMATTEDFIDRAATASSMSGRPYQVRCDGSEPVSSAEWLSTELQRLRRASAATEP